MAAICRLQRCQSERRVLTSSLLLFLYPITGIRGQAIVRPFGGRHEDIRSNIGVAVGEAFSTAQWKLRKFAGTSNLGMG